MKRILPILLILLLALSACSPAGQPTDSQAASRPETGAVSSDAAPVSSDAIPSSDGGQSAPTEAKPESSTQPGPTEPAAAFPQTLLDNEVCSISVVDAGMSDIWGFTAKLRCENKTEHSQLYLLTAAACRGWQLNTDFLLQVNAGESRESEFHVFPADLARCGLDEVDECRLHIQVQDYDDFSGGVMADEWLVFYPTGMSPEKITPAPARTPGADDALLVDDERVSFSICGVETETIYPFNLIVSYENKTDRDLAFSWLNVTVNGTDSNLWLSRVLPAGLKGCFLVYFDEGTLKGNGVESIKEVDLTLVIRDSATMEEYLNESFHYTAP